jgi:ABC-2 type transport system ATP-binding protein
MPNALEVHDLVKRYGDRTAVGGLSFAAEAGRITAILGPNGAGKTTTLECCEGLRAPDGGVVRVLGADPRRDGKALRPRIGVVLQSGGIYPTVRPLEMLRHVASLHAHPADTDALAERLGLTAHSGTPYKRLSGGEQRRLALALAVVGRPELVLLDEPTSGMDPQSRRVAWDLLTELRDEGVSVVVSTHHMDEAQRLADHVVVVDHGTVVAEGSPDELTTANARGSVRFALDAGTDVSSLASVLPPTVELVRTTGSEDLDAARTTEYVLRGEVDPGLLLVLTTWCAQRDVMPEGLTVERRTLEDVFLDLTGTELRA